MVTVRGTTKVSKRRTPDPGGQFGGGNLSGTSIRNGNSLIGWWAVGNRIALPEQKRAKSSPRILYHGQAQKASLLKCLGKIPESPKSWCAQNTMEWSENNRTPDLHPDRRMGVIPTAHRGQIGKYCIVQSPREQGAETRKTDTTSTSPHPMVRIVTSFCPNGNFPIA